jgi:hypothetical protein
VLYIITILALVSAIFLIAATMSALIAEQAREIAVARFTAWRRDLTFEGCFLLP